MVELTREEKAIIQRLLSKHPDLKKRRLDEITYSTEDQEEIEKLKSPPKNQRLDVGSEDEKTILFAKFLADPKICLKDLYNECQELRDQVDAIVKRLANERSTINVDQLLTIVRDVWKKCTKDPNVSCYFPELYETPKITSLLQTLAIGAVLLQVQTQDTNIQPGNGNNILLTGMRGVGKTTMMKCMAIVVALVFPHVFPVYHDYERDIDHYVELSTPRELVKRSLSLINTPVTEDGTLETLRLQKKYLMLFVDEIQVLYKKDSRQGEACIRGLLVYGKDTTTMCIASGSSSKIRDLAYGRGDHVKQHFSRYPSLGGGVYQEYRITPLRDKLCFTNAMRKLNSDLSDEQINTYYYYSGGIRRYMNPHKPPPQSFALHPFASKLQTYMKNNEDLVEVLRQLWQKNRDVTDIWELKGIKIEKLIRVGLGKHIDDWIDNNGLYQERDEVFFYSPWHRDLVNSQLQELPDYKTVMALDTVLIGWEDYPSDGSSSQLVDKYIRERYANTEKMSFNQRKLCMNHREGLYVAKRLNADQKEETRVELDSIFNEMLGISKKNGLDGICIKRVSGSEEQKSSKRTEKVMNKDEYHVDLYQIIIGKLSEEIKLHSLREILDKANNGWLAVLTNLEIQHPSVTFKPSSITIIMSMKMDHGEINKFYKKTTSRVHPVTKEGLPAAHFAVSTSTEETVAIPLYFFDQDCMYQNHNLHFTEIANIVNRVQHRHA